MHIPNIKRRDATFIKTTTMVDNHPVVEYKYTKKVEFETDNCLASTVENLNTLKRSSFNRIKIPKFSFTTVDKTLHMDIEHISGRPLKAHTLLLFKQIIWNDLVQSLNLIAPTTYEPSNFIFGFDRVLYYVDLEDIRPYSIAQRTEKYHESIRACTGVLKKNPYISTT
tara:strand:- start:217 stop:720 length:504 start_codon:yes stop_codon:yes gene_type:complete